jgi:radical SAM superfamily enzyme YgiQ (UPF0313 family)
MNILLVRPPYKRLMGIRQTPYFSLSIGYVGTCLEKHGFRVGLYNGENEALSRLAALPGERDIFESRRASMENYFAALKNERHPAWTEFRGLLDRFEPDAVGISVLSNEVGAAVALSRLVKSRRPGCPVVWGGVHPTFLPDASLGYGCVDYVVRGEGEETMLELCRFFETGSPAPSDIRGLSFIREDGAAAHTADRPLFRDIDALPFPDRRLSLLPERLKAMDTENLIASRGCPYRCTFCSSRLFWQKQVRMRSPEKILDEIEALKKSARLRHFIFLDDSFTLRREDIETVCRSLIRERTGIFWSTMTRADLLDEDLIGLMKRSGCIELNLGIETGSERMSRMISKDLKKAHVIQTVARIKKAGISCGTFFILGFPEETLDDLGETFDFMKSLAPTRIGLNIFEPQPGSELYERMIAMGLLSRDLDWAGQAFWPVTHTMKHVPEEAFASAVKDISAWVFQYNARAGGKLRKYRTHFIGRLRRDPRYFFYRAVKWGRTTVKSLFRTS